MRDLLAEKPAKAVALLEHAAGESPRDPRVLSDLAAAYLTRASKDQRPEDRVRGLSAALQALRIEPSLPEAAFNRALALEKLSLKGAALAAWEACSQDDPDPEWRRAAAQHRQALARPAFWQLWDTAQRQLEEQAVRQDIAAVSSIVHAYPQPAREYVEQQELGAWADAVTAGDVTSARQALWLAGAIGDALADVTGDLMVRDAVAAIRRAAADPAGGRLEPLARGHRAFRDAQKLYADLRFETAAPLLESATADLERGGSPMAAWAAYYRAVCFYPQGKYKAALDALGRITRDPGHARHPVLLGYAKWMTGTLLADHAQFGDSLDRYRRALDLFERTLQTQNTAILHDQLANNLDLLGETREAWEHLSGALAGSDRILKRRWVTTILQKAAACALRMDQPAAALVFHEEAVRVARQQKDPLVVSESLVSRSLSRLGLGDSAGALSDLETARDWMEKKPADGMRRVVESQLEAATGKALRATDPARAIELLGKALDLNGSRGAQVLRTELHVERGRAQLALGRDDLAEQDFAAGIKDFEQNRRKIFEEGLRISYFEQVRAVFDEMIRLQLDQRKDPWLAFRLSEQARARELLDTLAGGVADRLLESLESGQAGRDLPSDVTLVHYAVLEDRTLIWVLTRDHSEMFERPAGNAEIQKRVGALVGAIRRREDGDRIRSLAASLYEDLVRPIAGMLPPESTLVLVPDKALHKLPFAALYDAAAKRFLVEEHPLAVTPSGALVLHGTSLRAARSPHPMELRRALVVGNPRIDPQQFSGFTPLPGAEEEARKVAALYPEPELLTGAAATRDRFLAEAGRYEVIHFAGHALSNEEIPLFSMLLLAPNPVTGSSGELLAKEIYQQKFESTRLVVLGACSTTEARISPSEGVLGLARPFLAAGVPDVVSTLWEVEDATTPALFAAFHRHLRAGGSPIQALRAAQLDLLRSASPELRSPAAWAPFEVIQGSGR